jgi:hypothetical protein
MVYKVNLSMSGIRTHNVSGDDHNGLFTTVDNSFKKDCFTAGHTLYKTTILLQVITPQSD